MFNPADVKDSAAISQAIITGGAVAGALFALFQVHPSRSSQPLIDFDLALLLIPSLLLGTSIGKLAFSVSCLFTIPAMPAACSARAPLGSFPCSLTASSMVHQGCDCWCSLCNMLPSTASEISCIQHLSTLPLTSPVTDTVLLQEFCSTICSLFGSSPSCWSAC